MNRFKLIFSILVVTFSTMLLEVLMTRVFSVIYLGQFAFLIISLALFGYGLSGVYLSVSKWARKENSLAYLERFLLGFALSIPLVYKFSLTVTVDFLNLFQSWQNLLALALNFIILVVPFFFAGVALALIFASYSQQIGRLYFIDLAGAALGSLAIIPLIPVLGPTRIILILFLLVMMAWLLLASLKPAVKIVGLILSLAIFSGLFRFEALVFPIVPRLVEAKRFYNTQLERKRLEYSKWSTIDKIDVAPWPWKPPRKVIWINGGTMQSFIWQFDGNLGNLRPIEWDTASIPYQLTPRGTAFIIGSAGGYEVLCALSHRYKFIVAVEMDPVICDLLKKEYAQYTGNIFHLDNVRLLADEGRSALKRINKRFDVIQMVNSHNADFLLSGALSVAETYIYTVESFKDYWEHLNENGFISIVHWNPERLFTTALQALKDMGIDQPHKKIFVMQNVSHLGDDGFGHFFLKKGDLAPRDLEILKGFAEKQRIKYSPDRIMDNLYYRLLAKPEETIKASAVNISPVYDRSPYFNQPNKIGQFRFKNMWVNGYAEQIIKYNVVFSNSVYLAILGLAIFFSLLLIYLPLRRRRSTIAQKPLILYFFLIGVAFIIVEIIFIKIFQLFLGSPAVSISMIIFSLLVSSGVGSLTSESWQRWLKDSKIPLFALLVALILAAYAIWLFPILNAAIGLKFVGRNLFAFMLIFLPGFFMGNFFPYGIKRLGEQNRAAIGWAWGANAFATVLGSILAVIIAINWNFPLLLILSALCYLAAGGIAWRGPLVAR